MTEHHDKPEDRMESLLQLWGADQAAQQQDLPPVPPVSRPVRLDLRHALLYAGCVAAGALVAIGSMLLARNGAHRPAPREIPSVTRGLPPRTAPATQPAEDETQLAEEQQKQREAEFQALQAEAIQALETAEAKLADLRNERELTRQALAEAKAREETLAKKIKTLQDKQTQTERLQEATDRLEAKLENLRNDQERAQATTIRLRNELAVLRKRHRAKSRLTLEVYLTAVAPRQKGMAALQSAIRTSRLLERCMELRRTAETDETRRILDRIEAMLIQLDFLDINDVSSLIRFEKQIERSELLPEIAATLTRVEGNRRLQVFLAEVDLIFSGVEGIG